MINHVILMGNLTSDTELRYTPKGQPVCTFTIAHNKRWTTDAGEEREKVSFIGCVMFGKRAEAFAKHHRKGSKALVQGELTQDTWDDKETGKKREKTKVQVNSWEFVGGRAEATDRPAPAPRPATASTPAPAAEPEEDDCPF